MNRAQAMAEARNDAALSQQIGYAATPTVAAVRRAQLVADICIGRVRKIERAAEVHRRTGSWHIANAYEDSEALWAIDPTNNPVEKYTR
jgi:hypothetical protein